jgi:hypothetical protein
VPEQSAVRRLLTFPDPVNEYAARGVALGVFVMAATYVVTGWWWVLALITYGFLARVASGPRFSPLGLFVTRVAIPRSGLPVRLTPGPPKRFAQAIGATLSVAAVAARIGFDTPGPSRVLIAGFLVAAGLEAFAGICLGCLAFARLMKFGVIPEAVCEACADLSRPRPAQA